MQTHIGNGAQLFDQDAVAVLAYLFFWPDFQERAGLLASGLAPYVLSQY